MGVTLMPAIVVNYFVCYICGALLLDAGHPMEHFGASWFYYSMGLGVLFIAGFNFVGLTVQEYGVAMATLMQKMSIVLSVSFALIYFGESLGGLKVLGLVMALLSIVLYNTQSAKNLEGQVGLVFLIPILTWVISGLIEIGLLFTQKSGLIQGQDASFVSHIFLFAGLLGLLWMLFSQKIHLLLDKQSLLGGIYLGVPNFFSMYFLVLLLDTEWDGSVILPINNIGILVLSSVSALLIFRETNSKLQWLGILLAVIAILTLGLS
jgi:drug/metabolite transporter (DMT)-like permease